ncbi:MAG: class I mannose-6-phosphate isomerase [bacterium]|nr:class I mannose-6-phosphate isomerase [bacterium]
MDFTPIQLAPALKDYLWGGRRLITDFNIKTDLDKVAESWMLSTHPDGESIVISGKFAGKTLSEYISENGSECLGSNAAAFDFFPVLIKLIDAKDSLSIQVHPNDEYALRVEGEYGKTEVWYIADCEPDAYLYYGLNCKVTKEEFISRIESNTLLEILNKVPVHKGDVFFIPSGTIHAICAGILICEIQQNSNTTYRVYDYDRRGKDGKPRELHIEKAAEVSDLFPAPAQEKLPENMIARCKYFTAERVKCSGKLTVRTDEYCFRSLVILDGGGTLEMNNTVLELQKGDSVFIPAQNSTINLIGEMEGIISYV